MVNVSCNAGGTFYACSTGSRFVGCCLTNPCANGCAAGLLVPTSFDALQYGEFPDQQCNAGSFYTCVYEQQNTATFLGCCQTNPCSAGSCPTTDLAGSFLSNNPQEAAPFLSLNSSWLATAAVSSSAASTLATLTSSSAASSSATSTLTSTSTSVGSTTVISGVAASTTAGASPTTEIIASPAHSTNVGAIAGGAVGGFAVLAALVLGLLYLFRRRRTPDTPPQTAALAQEMESGEKNEHGTLYGKPSPQVSSFPGSPQPPYSPGPPSYMAEANARQMYELPGAQESELDSGQRYHAYRSPTS